MQEMRSVGQSLWNRIPASTRLGLVPILTTAFFVQSGVLTAQLLACLQQGALFCEAPNRKSVIDIQGLLILLNFVVVLWFSYRSLDDTLAKGDKIGIDVKIIGLASAFLSCLELYSYALKAHHPERLVFALPILFFVFFVPFVLFRDASAPAPELGDPVLQARATARHAYAALRRVICALIACTSATLAGTVYYIVLTDGLRLGDPAWIPPLVDRATWGFNPAILGLGWLPALFIGLRSDGSIPNMMDIRLSPSAEWTVLIGSCVINVIIGLALANAPEEGSSAAAIFVKAILGAGLTVIFLAACFVGRNFHAQSSRGLIGTAAVFVLFGVLAGFFVEALRWAAGDAEISFLPLALHGCGFALAYLAGAAALRWVQPVFSDLTLGARDDCLTASSAPGAGPYVTY